MPYGRPGWRSRPAWWRRRNGTSSNGLRTAWPSGAPAGRFAAMARAGRGAACIRDARWSTPRSVHDAPFARPCASCRSPSRPPQRALRTRPSREQPAGAGGGTADRPSVARQVDVQLRRGLGHVRIRQLPVQQPQGAGRRRGPERPVVRGLRQAGAVGELHRSTSSSEIYGKVSVVGERTYGSVPAAFGQDVSSFGPEDLYIGWRSGTSLTIGENALDFSVGRSQYPLGHGFLLFDGAAEGGSRGGYWTNARKAFEFAAIGRFQPGPHKVEVVLSRQGRARGERHRQPAVGHQLRVQPRRGHDARRDLHEVVRRSGDQARSATD